MRNTYSSKVAKPPTKISAVLLLAGKCRALSEYGPKSLLRVGPETLIERQIRILRALPGIDEIWAVVGHHKELLRGPTGGIRVVEHDDFEKTGVNKSVGLALRACPADNLLIIYGDLVFDGHVFDDIVANPEKSFLLYDKEKRIHYSKTGMVIQNNVVSHLTYGIEPKWGQLGYISSANMANFRDVVYNSEGENLSGCQLINKTIEKGCTYFGTSPAVANFTEVDAMKHITQFLKRGNS